MVAHRQRSCYKYGMTFFAAAVDPSEIKLGDTALRVGGLLLAYLCVTLAQRFLSRRRLFHQIELQLNLLVLVSLTGFFLAPVFALLPEYVGTAVRAAAVFLGVTIGLKLLDLLVIDRLARWRKKPPVPLVLRDLSRLALALLALVLIGHAFFPQVNLNVFAVSSLVVGYIIGNASQDTLGNLFAGLALNAERPFQIGDWVTVGGHTGVLVDTTWRATRLRTKTDDYIVIPNSAIAKESIINHSHPTRTHGCLLQVGVNYDTPPNKVREVILGVLQEAPGVSKEPAPLVWLVSYGDSSVNFTMKFFLDDFARLETIQSGIMDRVWYAFKREGISIPYPIRDMRQRDAAADERAQRAAGQDTIRQMLAGVELFQSLTAEELERLANSAKLHLYAAGENLCRQGEPGDSFYVIREGRVAILVTGANGNQVTAAHLSRGGFFGEMSLLTGEPRSGTVAAETDVEVLRVSKQDFAGLLQANAGLAGRLAIVIQQRIEERRLAMATSNTPEAAPEAHSLLALRIKAFFGLA
jgi:small-conductance mechanosensitive channel/CRP-like cAMP-binding protein